ncbi:UNVERIFIED_CONTAM: zinc finger, C3HC4 type (RING finger) domain-containing protein [Hammondia hammondi]|eukprot:XP_008882899.1 zinc finger, C3HC4 type (RING finger) domain-containing protein [Hammondia hammondi]
MADHTDTWHGAARPEPGSRTAFLLGLLMVVCFASEFLSAVLLAPLAALWTVFCAGDVREVGDSPSVRGSTHTASAAAFEFLVSLRQLGVLGIIFFSWKALRQGEAHAVLETLRAASASLLRGGVRRDKGPTAGEKRDAEDELNEDEGGEGDGGEPGKPSEGGDQGDPHEEKEDGDSHRGREADKRHEKGGEEGGHEERDEDGEDFSQSLWTQCAPSVLWTKAQGERETT